MAVSGKRAILYQVQFYTQNRLIGDKESLDVAQFGSISGDKARHSTKVIESMLLPGTYCLGVVVIAESEDVVPRYLELPMLRVV